MKRFCIPAMLFVPADTAEEATNIACEIACDVNDQKPGERALYLCEGSDTTEAVPLDQFDGTLAGLTCDYREVLRLRAALKRIADGDFDLMVDAAGFARESLR